MNGSVLSLSSLRVETLAAPASPTFLGENPRLGADFLDARCFHLDWYVSRGGRLGWDGASLEWPVERSVDPSGMWSIFDMLNNLSRISDITLSYAMAGYSVDSEKLFKSLFTSPFVSAQSSSPMPSVVSGPTITLRELPDLLSKIASSAEAKAEAKRIGAAIRNTFDNNNPWYLPSLKKDQRNKGYYCYEWAYGFEDAFHLESSGKFFEAHIEWAGNPSNLAGELHAWLAIKSKENPQKTIYVDDGFVKELNSYVHNKRPIPTDWQYIGGGQVVLRSSCWIPPAYYNDGRLPCTPSWENRPMP